LLSTPRQVAVIVVGVGVLVAFHAFVLSAYHQATDLSQPGTVDG
jgi:hypothetical protein